MHRKVIITCLLGAGIGLLGWSAAPAVPGGVAQPCETSATGPLASVPAIAVARGRILGSIRAGREVRLPDVRVLGVPRHVASMANRVAFVDDQPGPDDLVVWDGGVTLRLREPGEVLHPAWGPSGSLVWSLGDRLRLRTPSGDVRTIDAPTGSGSIFSPILDRSGDIIAVVAPTSADGPTEDELRNELWRFDRSAERWQRLTHERVAPGRWVAIRTPMMAPLGALEYVRVSGSDVATTSPRFELWQLAGDRASRIRALPSERYLAGFAGGRRLWNVFDRQLGDWLVQVEQPDGEMVTVGCGRVAVDPRAELDPDRTGAAPTEPVPPTPSPTVTPTPTATATPTTSPDPGPPLDPPAGPAILVGDFASLELAQSTAARILEAYGEGSGAAVIDGAVAPTVIQPGVWGVVLPIAAGSDPEAQLQAFRARFPDLAPWTWVVTV